MRNLKIIVFILFIFVFSLGTFQNAKITIKSSGKDNLIKSSICPAGDGKNELVPFPITYLEPAASPNLFQELKSGDTNFSKSKLSFKKGKALNGTLAVDFYMSKFKQVHFSGAHIRLRYIRHKGDPEVLRWVQLINTDRPMNNAKSPYIDPFPNDDPSGKDLPFYYTDAEIKAQEGAKKSAKKKYDLRFYDFSKRSHPPNSQYTWKAELYLVSWDASKKEVTIHDGIRWGWKGGCQRKEDDKSRTAIDSTAKDKIESTAVIPKGTQILTPSSFIENQPATIAVIAPGKGLLSGVVVRCGDQYQTTDKSGRATFDIPAGSSTAQLSIKDIAELPTRTVSISSLISSIPPEALPQIGETPAFLVPGNTFTCSGGPFSGIGSENGLKIGERIIPILACTPHEILAFVPRNFQVGTTKDMIVSTPEGESNRVRVTFVRLRLEADLTKLFEGQGTKGKIIVEGTQLPVTVRITNLTPQIITLKGGQVQILKTSGGKKNLVKIRFKGIKVGKFLLDSRPVDKTGSGKGLKLIKK